MLGIAFGILGGLMFLGAVIANVVIRLKLRPVESDEEVYWEFEDQDPDWNRYHRRLKTTVTIGAAGALLQFLALII